jgi:outer membrane protein assembly factor BamB
MPTVALMRRRLLPLLVIAAVLGVQMLVAADAQGAAPAWTTYRHDAARSGIDPDSTVPVTPAPAWQTPALDGEVYGQPLVYGAFVYVATENDTIYKLDAGTGGVVWSVHLATPEPSSVAPCGDISPSIGITSTPVIDPATNRIYAVGAVSTSGAIHHELFALDLGSGQPVAGFPVNVDPPFPGGGTPVNQLQRPGLALDAGRILIGYGGNDGDCNTYWGWLVSASTNPGAGITSFQVDGQPGHEEGAIWGGGNAPPVDATGNVYVATGNGSGATSDPDFGDSVVKLNAMASPLDWWAPINWQTLDSTDADLGSSMPALLPGGFLFQSGKDNNGYLLNGAALGHVSSPVGQTSSFCSGMSFGGAVFDPGNSAIYAACNSGLKALSFAGGPTPSIAPKSGFAAPGGATGPPMIAGGLVWVTNHSSGTLFGLDPTSGSARSQFSIPEKTIPGGSDVNHFASPSAGGGRLFVGSGDQVTAYTIAQAPPPTSTSTTLVASPNPTPAGGAVSLTATVGPTPDAGTITFTDGGAPIAGCSGVAVSAATGGHAACRAAFARPGTHTLSASYSGDAFYAASTSARLGESVNGAVPRLTKLHLSSHRVSIAGRKVHGRCVTPTKNNKRHARCRRPIRLKITYTLNTSATVKVTFKRHVAGRKGSGRCVAPTKKNRKRERCTRLVTVPGSVTLHGKSGANAFTLTGKIGRRMLGPGTYQLTARPSANGRTGSPQRVTFTIIG